jgi:hypothetical protein
MGQLIPLHRDLPPNLRPGPLPARVVVPQAARIRPPLAASERHAPPFNYARTATQAPAAGRAPHTGPPRAGVAPRADRAPYADREWYDRSWQLAGTAPTGRLAPPADPFGTDEVRLFPDLDATGDLEVTENLAVCAPDEVTDSLELPVEPANGDDHAASDTSAESDSPNDVAMADSPSSPAPLSPPPHDSGSVYASLTLTATFADGEPESRRLLPGITSHAGRSGSGWRFGRRSRTRALRGAEDGAARNDGATRNDGAARIDGTARKGGAARNNGTVVGETHQAAGA